MKIKKSQIFFKNKINKILDEEIVINDDSKFTENFSKQWNTYKNTQIDEKNNFKITYNFLKNLFFDDLEILKNSNILEIGCGSGRFTEYFNNYCKLCISVDLSDAVFSNDYRFKPNVEVIKADFTELTSAKKFDIVFCRGVLQHTQNPEKSILKLFDFIKKDGIVIFDYYLKPKIGLFHPKYLYWRPIFKRFVKYKSYENFLSKNIYKLLKLKRILDKIFLNKHFFSDCLIPIWDAGKIIPGSEKLSFEKICELSILDTLDGLYAYYDKPKKNLEIVNFLQKNKFKIIKNNKKLNCFMVKI